MHILNDLGKA